MIEIKITPSFTVTFFVLAVTDVTRHYKTKFTSVPYIEVLTSLFTVYRLFDSFFTLPILIL